MSEQSYEPREGYSEGQPRRTRRGGGIGFAITLIAVGIVALLANLNLIHIQWDTLVRFWPVLLILLGLDVLIGRQSALGGILVGVISAGVIAAVVLFGSQLGPGPQAVSSGERATGTISEEVTVKSLKVRVDLSVMALELGKSDGKTITGDYETDKLVKPTIKYTTIKSDTGELTITQPEGNFPFSFDGSVKNRMQLNLPADVPIDLEVHSDLGQVIIDVSDLNITSLTVESNSGQVQVTLPTKGKLDIVDISADLGQIIVKAPDGADLDVDTFKVEDNSGQVVITLPAAGTIGDFEAKTDLGQLLINVPTDARLNMGSYTARSGSGSLTAQLPANGTLGAVNVKGDLGSVTVSISGGPGDLTVASLDVKSGSGSLTVELPAKGDYNATIEADLGSITVSLPDSIEAHVEIDSSLSKPSVSGRLTSTGSGVWETSGYKNADNKVDLKIDSGSGSVTVN